jgi:hypothetical protein
MQLRMNNPHIQIILGIRHRSKTNKTENTIQKVKKMCNTEPTKKLGVNTGARAFPVYYNTTEPL